MSQWQDEAFDPEAFSVADDDALLVRFGPATPTKR
jgi:hypothetical protein